MIEDIKTLREEHVYRAKLAEQAERYDGRSLFSLRSHSNRELLAPLISLFHSSPPFWRHQVVGSASSVAPSWDGRVMGRRCGQLRDYFRALLSILRVAHIFFRGGYGGGGGERC